MSSTNDIGTSSVNGRVDHERSSVEEPIRASVNDLAIMIDLDQIRGFHQRKRGPEWIDPESGWVHGVAKSDMASDA